MSILHDFEFLSGQPLPLGPTVMEQGVNFAIFSRNADAVSLVVYQNETEEMPLFIHALDATKNKTGDVWHCFVKGLKEGYWYGYWVDGPYEPKAGHRFNPNKLLLDPYARVVSINSPFNSKEMFGYDRDTLDLSFLIYVQTEWPHSLHIKTSC